jgi:hypothetical protein
MHWWQIVSFYIVPFVSAVGSAVRWFFRQLPKPEPKPESLVSAYGYGTYIYPPTGQPNDTYGITEDWYGQ